MTVEDFSLKSVWEAVGPFLPPMIGGFIGLRYSQDASKRDQAIAWTCSGIGAIYLSAAIGELYQLGPKMTVAAGFLIAMFGSQLFAIAIAAMKQWSADPVGTFRRYRNAFMGRSDDA